MKARKWTYEKLVEEAKKYNSRREFELSNAGAYTSAIRQKVIDKICIHMRKSKTQAYTAEELKAEALKYKTRYEFAKNARNYYNSAWSRNLLDEICGHMLDKSCQSEKNRYNFKWTDEKLQKEALKYRTKKEFRINSGSAYTIAINRGILNQICTHMDRLIHKKWTYEELQKEALKYKTVSDFKQNSRSAYESAVRRKILQTLCKGMIYAGGKSELEQDLFNLIKQKFPKTQKLRDHKVKITNKPYIHGLDIDIYIPELRKGIEFDGSYWHSIEGLKRSRKDWPDSDLKNYHKIKDDYFKSKGIEILHIKEKDWLENKDECFKKCLEFLYLEFISENI